jgi:hypothetical protein
VKPRLQFTVRANPSTDWAVRVLVWKNLKQLRIHTKTKDALGLCKVYSKKKAVKRPDNVFAEISLAVEEPLRAATILHECFHALISYANLCKLRTHDGDCDAEEVEACSLEHMYTAIVEEIQSHKIKIVQP